jgi:hypothetical protein
MTNKTIYMTYKKNVPDKVFDRWKKLNPDYNIDFSFDNDCIEFLKNNFNDYIVNLFKVIKVGMYKADLWRLCKLYIHGGVYADVDLVPYINIDNLDKEISFYSCISDIDNSIFQAFIVNFSKPKNPLILHFILSYLLNNPHQYSLGPTFDMYNCLKYNLNNENIKPDTKYNINEIKINVFVGPSNTHTKIINLFYFPNDVFYTIKLVMINNPYSDRFDCIIENNYLYITRIDDTPDIGWAHPHSVDICINSKETIYLFKETVLQKDVLTTAIVTHNNTKILDSRDPEYANNKGW